MDCSMNPSLGNRVMVLPLSRIDKILVGPEGQDLISVGPA